MQGKEWKLTHKNHVQLLGSSSWIVSNVQLHLQEYLVKYSSLKTEWNSPSKAKPKGEGGFVSSSYKMFLGEESTEPLEDVLTSVTQGGALFPSFSPH